MRAAANGSSRTICSRKSSRCEGLRARAWLGEQHLHIAQLPLDKAAFAVAQVVLPQTHECIRVAERLHLGEAFEERLAPAAQGRRVVRADIEKVKYLHVGC